MTRSINKGQRCEKGKMGERRMRAKAQAKHVSRSTENKAVRKRKAGKAKSEEKTFVLKKHTSKYYEHNDGLNPKTSSFAKATTTAKGRKTISRTATWKKSESACLARVSEVRLL